MTASEAEASPGLPVPRATVTLLVVIWLLFLGENLYPAGGGGQFGDPSLLTLVAWGGMSHALVVAQGEWFRIFTAALLHGGVMHILFNSIGLFAAGRLLEPFIGWPWFLGLFVIGALGGGLASITYNPPNIVAVGASGAIMGLFGFFLTIALRFPAGDIRKSFVSSSLGALIPSLLPALLPAVTGGQGFSIDYAAHGGGALAGAGLGGIFLVFWRKDRLRPPATWLAFGLVFSALVVLVYGASVLKQGFGERAFAANLMPEAQIRKLDGALDASALDRIMADYPDDPRGFLVKARTLLRAGKPADALPYAQKAVERAERFPRIFTPQFKTNARLLFVAILLDLQRMDEAQTAAAPICKEREPAAAIALIKRHGACPSQ